jgi:hypothetical protein
MIDINTLSLLHAKFSSGCVSGSLNGSVFVAIVLFIDNNFEESQSLCHFQVRLQQVLKQRSRKKGKQEAAVEEEASKDEIAKHRALQKQVQKFIKQKKLRVLMKKVREADSSEPWSRIIQAHVSASLSSLFW